ALHGSLNVGLKVALFTDVGRREGHRSESLPNDADYCGCIRHPSYAPFGYRPIRCCRTPRSAASNEDAPEGRPHAPLASCNALFDSAEPTHSRWRHRYASMLARELRPGLIGPVCSVFGKIRKTLVAVYPRRRVLIGAPADAAHRWFRCIA